MKRKSLPTGRDFLFVEGYGNENPGAFQSPRPLRGATIPGADMSERTHISTHAPLAGRDRQSLEEYRDSFEFQPTCPLRGATWAALEVKRRHLPFQPTCPLRGATFGYRQNADLAALFQPTCPLRGATAKVYKSLCTFLR